MRAVLLLLISAVVVTVSFHIKAEVKSTAEKDIIAVNYPVRAAYIDRSEYWYGDSVAIALAVPGFAPPHKYNMVLLSFWSCLYPPQDLALVWSDLYLYFGADNSFGNDTQSVQKALRDIYHKNGMKIMVSAFGATQFPTSMGEDPTVCANKLAQFVLDNNLDGADIDWEDNDALEAGTGQAWLITFTQTLRAKLPSHIITHAPQAPYFKNEFYPKGGYKAVHDKVGSMIDLYLIQFYNQGDSRYDSYEELFTSASGSKFAGTSVKEIAERGIPLNKLVVGKPILPSDACNTGWVESGILGGWAARAFDEFGWFAGIMHWQYPSDKTGGSISAAAGPLIQKCETTKKCI